MNDTELSVESEVKKNSEFVEDQDEVAGLLELLKQVNISGSDVGMESYKGKLMKSKEAHMMKHIVDKMKDHFGNNTPPKVSFVLEELSNLGYEEQYKSKHDAPGDRWYSEVKMMYTVSDEQHLFDVVAFDNIYFDLVPKISRSGTVSKNYGETWINVYIPYNTLKTFLAVFKKSTGWGVSASIFVKYDHQSLVSISASISEDEEPKLYSVIPEVDEHDTPTGRVEILNQGTIQNLCQNPDFQSIYVGTGFFSLSMNVITGLSSTIAPAPGPTSACRIKFGLISVRAFGISNNVTPVKLGKKCVSGKNF
jgi:hypothetical protein